MAFENLVELYYQPVFHFASCLCGTLERALELTQHTFCLALSRQSYFGGTQAAESWLYTLLFREFLKEKRHRTLALSNSAFTKSSETSADCGTTANSKRATRNSIVPTRLREESQIPLILFHHMDFSCSEIADYLGISMEAVLTHLSRGVDKSTPLQANAKPEGRKNCPCPLVRKQTPELLRLAA